MRVEQLLKREPFGEVLERTLAGYWGHRGSGPVSVTWHGSGPIRGSRQGERWYGNLYTNAFARKGTPASSFEALRLEYGRSLSWWKRDLQALYVRAATAERTMPYLAQVGFSCAPAAPERPSTIILGGNHRLRLLEPEDGRATVVIKSGYPVRFVESDVALRTKARPDFAPPLRGIDLDHGCFSEDYIPGTPINRVKGGGLDLAAEIVHGLETQVWRPSLAEGGRGEWAESKFSRLRALLASRRDAGEGPAGEEAVVELWRAAVRTEVAFMPVPEADTHGDVQPANIVLSGGRPWLIDWESAARRFAGYDWLTFETQVRQRPGLDQACATILRERRGQSSARPERIFGLGDWTTDRRRWAIAWLVEELLYELEAREGLHGEGAAREMVDLYAQSGKALAVLGSAA